MRTDSIKFATADRALDRRPRFVVRIGFPTASVYCTSHDDIPSVPGIVIAGSVLSPSAVSQRLIPDEGRSEIGSFSCQIVDLQGALTDAIKAHLADAEGLRDREVKFFVGYEGFDFTEFQLLTTQIVVDDSVQDSIYNIQCRDITRFQNQEIFRPASTTLRATIDATSLLLLVNDTTGYEMVAHGSSFTDAPNATVGYVRIEDEIVRWISKTPNTFTLDQRGCFNTVPKEHAIDSNESQDRQPKVEEYIYLEMPGPKMALAIMRGDGLPSNWTLGINPLYIRENDFEAIGPDLWNTSNDEDSFVLRFEGLQAQDGKRFLEREIYLPCGCYSPVYSDGAVGLKRQVPLISAAAPSFTLDESTIISLSPLQHDGESMHNYFRVLWAFDTIIDDFIRQSMYIDEASQEVHGLSPLLTYEFRGIHSARHTDVTIARILASIRDRYSTPPERLTVTAFATNSAIEIGDVGRVKVSADAIRDYYEIESEAFDRSFEVHQRTYDPANGQLTVELFGSTFRPVAQPPISSTLSALPETFYTSAGTALSAVSTISGSTVQPGSYTLNGNADMRAAGAVFYHNGDLTIGDGANFTITQNVQLRVRGFLQINGSINGSGGGLAGVTDPGGGGLPTNPIPGNPGFLGHSRGWDGIQVTILRSIVSGDTVGVHLTKGKVDAVPTFDITVKSGQIIGLPEDMRGGGGGPGGRYYNLTQNVNGAGGAGAAGGAGLLIICRGLAMGASGSITLDGLASAATTSAQTLGDGHNLKHMHPGAGGGGGPGAMLVLIDGSSISFPTLGGQFHARGGHVPHDGSAMAARQKVIVLSNDYLDQTEFFGFADPDAVTLDAHDYSPVAFGIQYLAEELLPNADQATRPPPPTGLTAASAAGGNLLRFVPPPPEDYTVIEVYASQTNNRTDALFVGEVKGSSFMHVVPLGQRLYYWIRASRTYANGRPAVRSTWEPVSVVGGVVSSAETPGEAPDQTADFWAVGQTNGIRFSWAMPSVGRLLGAVRLWESATPNFVDAVMIKEVYGFAYTLPKTDQVTRYYWIQLFRGGVLAAIEPEGQGLPASAIDLTPQLRASVAPLTYSITMPDPPGGATTPPVIVTAGGGIPPYTYSWAWIVGNFNNLITNNAPFSNVTTFSTADVPYRAKRAGTARCTVTDSLGFEVFVDFPVSFRGRTVIF
jgi:hypothetical protein